MNRHVKRWGAPKRPLNAVGASAVTLILAVCVALSLPVPASAAAPANDNFANAEVLTGPTDSASGTNVDATKEAGEPNHAGNEGGSSIWFAWQAPKSGKVSIDTCDSDFDTLLAVYTGSAVNSLTTVASNDDAPYEGSPCRDVRQSVIRFTATAGTTYRIAVDGYTGTLGGAAEGAVKLDLDSSPANDDFANAEVLTGTTASASGSNELATKEAGEPNHDGNVGGASVWYRWQAPQSGMAYLDTCDSDFGNVLAVYTGSAVNSLTWIASNDESDDWSSCSGSELSFRATAGTTYRIAVDGWNPTVVGPGGTPAEGSFELGLDLVPAPANDDFANAEVLSGTTASVSGSNQVATKETGEPNHAGEVGGASVWYRWQAPKRGRFSIDTCDSDFDTLLAVYTGSAVNSLTTVASNDDGTCGSGSELSFAATAGATYRIAVDGLDGEEGAVELDLDFMPPPANDDFPNADVLSGSSDSASGTSVGAVKEAGEPKHVENPGGASVWYRWQAPKSGKVSIDTCDSDFDTLLAVYTGSAVNSLTTVASNDDGTCGSGSELSFAATAGATYRIAVDGYFGADGGIGLVLALDAATDSPPQTDSAACQRAKKKLKRARKSLTRAKKKLKRARKLGNTKKVKSAKRNLRKAKKVANRAKRLKNKACRGSDGQPGVPANRPPRWPEDVGGWYLTSYVYSGGFLLGAYDYYRVVPAVDPDGDALTYSWSASGVNGVSACAGHTTGSGPENCEPTAPPGYKERRARVFNRYNSVSDCFWSYTLTITVSDGRGGEDTVQGIVGNTGGC